MVSPIDRFLGRLPEPWWHAWTKRADGVEQDEEPEEDENNGSSQLYSYRLIDLIRDIGKMDIP